MTLLTIAILVTGLSSPNVEQDAAKRGCMVASAASAGIGPSSVFQSARKVLPHPLGAELDNLVAGEALLLYMAFGMSQPKSEGPLVWYYDDRGAPNAFATSEIVQLDGRRGIGTVGIGISMIRKLYSESRDGSGVAIAGLMAHEFGHIVQFQKRSKLTGKYPELQADFIAGWYTGLKQRYRVRDVQQVFDAFYNIGDFAYNSPAHHGTPSERLAATLAGFNLGHEEKEEKFDVVYRKSVEYIARIRVSAVNSLTTYWSATDLEPR